MLIPIVTQTRKILPSREYFASNWPKRTPAPLRDTRDGTITPPSPAGPRHSATAAKPLSGENPQKPRNRCTRREVAQDSVDCPRQLANPA